MPKYTTKEPKQTPVETMWGLNRAVLEANQCVEGHHPVDDPTADYLTRDDGGALRILLDHALVRARGQDMPTDTLELLKGALADSDLRVAYPQLERLIHEEEYDDLPEPYCFGESTGHDNIFESFKHADKLYCIRSSTVYRVLNSWEALKNSKVVAGIEDDDGTPYQLRVSITKSTKDLCPPYNRDLVKLEYGVRGPGWEFADEPTVLHIDSPSVVQHFKPLESWPHVQAVAMDVDAPQPHDKLRCENFQIEAWHKKRKEDGYWEPICNFTISRIVKIMAFVDDSKYARHRFEFKYRKPDADNDDEVKLATGQQETDDPAGVWVLESDICIPENNTTQHLHKTLTGVHPHFAVHGWNPTLFNQWVSLLSKPPITRVSTFWGRQEDDVMRHGKDTFLLGNCAISKQTFFEHDEVGCTVLRDSFHPSVTPERGDEPKALLVLQPWVRFRLLQTIWHDLMPKIFLANLEAAKAVFAHAVAGLQYSKFCDGQARGQSFPGMMAYSRRPNTGKTQALLLVNGMLGCHKKGLFLGAATSDASKFNWLTTRGDMVCAFDEIWTAKIGSKACHTGVQMREDLKKMIHATYDRTSRGRAVTQVSQGNSKPRSSWVGSANSIPFGDDPAAQERFLVAHFDNIPKTDKFTPEERAARDDAEDKWPKACEAASCLMMDLAQICREDGTLDAKHLRECSEFMNAVCGETYARQANGWGTVLYFTFMLEMLCGCKSNPAKLLDHICGSCVRTTHELKQTREAVHHFVLELHKVRSHASMDPLGPIEKSINWHNLRVNTKNPDFIAVRLEYVCWVINNVLHHDLDPNEIKQAIDGTTHYLGTEDFYDPQKWSWPDALRIIHIAEDNSYKQTQGVPLPEDQLQDEHCSTFECLWISKQWYDDVVKGVMRKVDYTQITLNRHTRPFYDQLCDGTWPGYQVLKNNEFRMYAMCNDYEMFPPDDADAEADLKDPRALFQHYNYTSHATGLPKHFAEDTHVYQRDESETEDDEPLDTDEEEEPPVTAMGPRGGSIGKAGSPVKISDFDEAEMEAFFNS